MAACWLISDVDIQSKSIISITNFFFFFFFHSASTTYLL